MYISYLSSSIFNLLLLLWCGLWSVVVCGRTRHHDHEPVMSIWPSPFVLRLLSSELGTYIELERAAYTTTTKNHTTMKNLKRFYILYRIVAKHVWFWRCLFIYRRLQYQTHVSVTWARKKMLSCVCLCVELAQIKKKVWQGQRSGPKTAGLTFDSRKTSCGFILHCYWTCLLW